VIALNLAGAPPITILTGVPLLAYPGNADALAPWLQPESPVFTYICLGTSDLSRATAFYDAVLAPLGLQRCATPGENDWEEWAGWGTYEDQGARETALWVCKPFNGAPATAGNGTMVALRATSWAAVQGFHAAALHHGGVSEGEPGLRPQYNEDFYAAYVRDPDGNKLAAVCRGCTGP
jgi:catechol 2,3-dioxygenase-like lactoylglutathione lyase family enzyme